MPIPKPHSDEVENDYIGRCISEIHGEYEERGQAYAVCKSTWDKREEMDITPNPCWKGYEPIGLKPDGSPNCVPIKMSGIDLGAVEGKTKHSNIPPREHDVHHGATSDKAAKAVKPKGIFEEEMAKERIPVEIAGDNEEKILEYLPEVKPKEMEDAYLERCVVVLYPEYVDEQQAYSLCADKYQRKITIQNNKQTMKPVENKFEKNRLNFQVAMAESSARGKGINLADYPWDECIADQIKQYGDEDIAKKVCGMIKSKYGGGE